MLLLDGCCVYIDSCRSISLFQNSQTCYVQVWDRRCPYQLTFPSISCTPTPQPPAAAAAKPAVATAAASAGRCYDLEAGNATTADTSATVCIAFVGPRSSSKVTIVFSKIRERVKKF